MTANRFLRILLVTLIACGSALAQGTQPWRGKACAVVLTYDDALDCHLDTVVPLLDSLGFKGTFYVSGYFPGFRSRTTEWAEIAKRGHELGNHTLFHPCDSRPPGRDWVVPEYDLRTYTVRRMRDEIQMANVLLRALDGCTIRSFAYPCGDAKAGDSSYVGIVRRLFPGARGVEGNLRTLREVDLYNVGSFMIADESSEQLVRLVEKARTQQALLVFLFHGVGGGHSISVPAAAHRQLLEYLKAHEQVIWVAPFREMVRYLRDVRGEPWRLSEGE